MAKKRERLEIIKDILQVVKDSRKIKPTRLLYSSNLSPQMFKEYVTELQTKGFVDEMEEKKKKFFILTEKGETFLEEYKQLSSFVKNFGL
jgi:predicted transcriptional regulator